MKLRRFCSAAALLFASAAFGSANAQDKLGFCADYANESVEMQRRNVEYRCGYDGLRWHAWWDGHYGWCKDWVSPSKVDEERELRRIQISKCTGGRDADTRSGPAYSQRDTSRDRRPY